MKIVIVSGYFNPVHRGHIEYLQKARELGDKLYVIVNNDIQRSLKGSKQFMNQEERWIIMQNLKMVDEVFLSIDKDSTVCRTLEYIHSQSSQFDTLVFANGGDQSNKNIPEKEVCARLGIELVDGLGDKVQSSSWLLKNN